MDEESERIIREGAEAWAQIWANQSKEMRAAAVRRYAAVKRVEMVMLELVEAIMEEEAQVYREAGDSEEQIAAYQLRPDDEGRIETLKEITDDSYDLPDAAWWALAYAFDAVALIPRVPVTPETLADSKRWHDEIEQDQMWITKDSPVCYHRVSLIEVLRNLETKPKK